MLMWLLRPHQRLSGNHFFLSSVSSLIVPRISWDSRDFIEKKYSLRCKEKCVGLLKVCNFADYLTDLAVLGVSWTPLEGENFSTSWLI